MLPFDTGARRKRGFSRAIAPGTSGQAGSTCQARLRARRVSSPRSATPKRGRMRSRLRRCSTSSFENGTRPDRTSFMAGWYSPRQASAKAGQSRAWPSGDRMRSLSRAMPVRQSTRVPKTSKNRAFGVSAMRRSCPAARSSQEVALSLRDQLLSRHGACDDLFERRLDGFGPKLVRLFAHDGALALGDPLDRMLDLGRQRRVAEEGRLLRRLLIGGAQLLREVLLHRRRQGRVVPLRDEAGRLRSDLGQGGLLLDVVCHGGPAAGSRTTPRPVRGFSRADLALG